MFAACFGEGGDYRNKCYICPYADLLTIVTSAFVKTFRLGKLKLPFRPGRIISMFLPVCLDLFPHLVLPFYPLSSALLSKLLLSEQSRMCCKAWKYKLGYSEINSLADGVSWDISDLDVLPHRNGSTRFFGFVV